MTRFSSKSDVPASYLYTGRRKSNGSGGQNDEARLGARGGQVGAEDAVPVDKPTFRRLGWWQIVETGKFVNERDAMRMDGPPR